MNGNVFWLTGISGAGKSTIAKMCSPVLDKIGVKVKVVDGDDVRESSDLKVGFSRDDVFVSNMRVCDYIDACLFEFDVILVPVIAPYREVREKIKLRYMDSISFIYCNASIGTAFDRDTKGLYTKALKGEIDDLIGFSTGFPYEIPFDADLVLETDNSGYMQMLKCRNQLIEYIIRKSSAEMHEPSSI